MTPSVAKSMRRGDDEDNGTIRISQLNLVDLAGSERSTSSDARNKEASYIKKSLLALQAVITSLASSSPSASNHIPYRNSHLTRLLQSSLSGNAKVLFLCTVSPSPTSEIETLSTLRFAAGAKKIKTNASVGKVCVDKESLLVELERRCKELEAALITNADFTEAVERERDEQRERAEGESRSREEMESRLMELQNQRTPLREQHEHLRRLIVTGSPGRNSLGGVGVAGSPLARRGVGKGMGATPGRVGVPGTPGRVRMSDLGTAKPESPRKGGWRELLFGTDETEEAPKEADEEVAGLKDKIKELELSLAKAELTVMEAEDTHQGQIVQMQEEIDAAALERENAASEVAVKMAEMEERHQAEIFALKEKLAIASTSVPPSTPSLLQSKFVASESRCRTLESTIAALVSQLRAACSPSDASDISVSVSADQMRLVDESPVKQELDDVRALAERCRVAEAQAATYKEKVADATLDRDALKAQTRALLQKERESDARLKSLEEQQRTVDEMRDRVDALEQRPSRSKGVKSGKAVEVKKVKEEEDDSPVLLSVKVEEGETERQAARRMKQVGATPHAASSTRRTTRAVSRSSGENL